MQRQLFFCLPVVFQAIHERAQSLPAGRKNDFIPLN
jgi:hypothetical protein